MLIGEPGRTDYDINFRIFGFPVRIHPAFFIMPLVLGQGFLEIAGEGGFNNVGVALLVLEFVFLLSLLVHELGHSFAMRYFGIESHIVLYWMGGLAIPGNGFTAWNGGRRRAVTTPTSQIIISLAGPFSGFMLAAVLAGLTLLLGGRVYFKMVGFVPMLIPELSHTLYANNLGLIIFLNAGLFCNVVWNLLNLIPAMPLDGGQVARNLFAIFDPWNGTQKAAMLGTVAAGAVALLGLMNQQVFMGLMFGMLALQNYQLANSGMGGGRPW